MALRGRTTARVRYAETDQMGVVYHAHYVVYFELGRTEFMRENGLRYADMEQAGQILAVVDLGARYVRSARYDDLLAIETRLVRATGVQVRFEYRILRAAPAADAAAPPAEELLCEGHTTLACVNAAGRPTRITSPWRERIAALVDSAANESHAR